MQGKLVDTFLVGVPSQPVFKFSDKTDYILKVLPNNFYPDISNKIFKRNYLSIAIHKRQKLTERGRDRPI